MGGRRVTRSTVQRSATTGMNGVSGNCMWHKFKIERTVLPSQDILEPFLPLSVQVKVEERGRYSGGGELCRCRQVYRVGEGDVVRIGELVNRVPKGEVYVCGCYGRLGK